MKALTNILTRLLMLMLLLVACTEEAAEVDNLSRGEQYVTVRMNIPGMTATATRADDGVIESITALAFDDADKLLEIETITTVTNTNTNGGFNGTFNLTVPNGTTTIHFLANLPNDVDIPESGSEVDVMTSLTTGDYNNLCYWGMTTTWDGNTNPLNVTLYRNLAKISIKPSITDTEFNQFAGGQLKIAGLINANQSGTLVPYANSNFHSGSNAPNYLTLPNPAPSLDNIQYNALPSDVYTFEHDNPADWNEGLFVICYIGDAYYKVALTKDGETPYDIIRNHEYIIYVSDVDDYQTENYRAEEYADVFDKDPINLNVQQEVIETVELGISAATQALNYNDTSTEQVTVTVTVPAGVQQLTLEAPGFTIESGDGKMTKVGDGVYTLNETTENQFVRFTLTLNNETDATSTISVSGEGESITVTGAETDITISEGTTTENQIVWWQGAMQLDAADDETKLSILYSYFFDESGNKLIPIGSEIYIDYEKLNDGWIAAQTPNNGSDWQDLGTNNNNNRITIEVTEAVYTQINNHHNTVFDGIDAAFIVQGVERVLKKITLKRAEPTIQTVKFSPTNDQIIYLGGDPLTITMTVPEGGTLNTLNIKAEGFNVASSNGTLTGPTENVYSYTGGTATFTFTPTTTGDNKTITFTGSGTNLTVTETTINVTVKEKIDATPTTSTTLYYDATEDQTVGVKVTVPAGVTTLNIEAADFSAVSADGDYTVSGDATKGYSVLLASDGKKQINFTFTLVKSNFSEERTSTTITFSDASGNATSTSVLINIVSSQELILFESENGERRNYNNKLVICDSEYVNNENNVGYFKKDNILYIDLYYHKSNSEIRITDAWDGKDLISGVVYSFTEVGRKIIEIKLSDNDISILKQKGMNIWPSTDDGGFTMYKVSIKTAQ